MRSTPAAGGAKQILVLEDEDAVRNVLVDILRVHGYDAIGLGDLQAALARSDLAPDLILLDMLMPGMDGFEFLARIRAGATWAHVPVIIVSALGSMLQHTIDDRAARTLGIAAILAKPFNATALIAHVRRALGE